MFQVDRAVSGIIERRHTGVMGVFLVLVVIGEVAFVVGIDDVPIPRIGNDKAALAAARLEPILRRDNAGVGPAGDADIGVVLLGAVDVVGKRVVDGDVIKLSGRLIVLGCPRLASVSRNSRATVVGICDSLRILWIDPETVMIAVAGRQKSEGFSAVDRAEEPGI